RSVVGGAAVTEEFHPGFRNSVASYTVSLLQPKVIRDLELHRHGLKIIERKVSNFLPLPNGDSFATGPGITAGEVARFSNRDVERCPQYEARLEAIADVLRDLALKTPPNLVERGWREALPEMISGLGFAQRLNKLDIVGKRDLLDLFGESAGDMLDFWFEGE